MLRCIVLCCAAILLCNAAVVKEAARGRGRCQLLYSDSALPVFMHGCQAAVPHVTCGALSADRLLAVLCSTHYCMPGAQQVGGRMPCGLGVWVWARKACHANTLLECLTLWGCSVQEHASRGTIPATCLLAGGCSHLERAAAQQTQHPEICDLVTASSCAQSAIASFYRALVEEEEEEEGRAASSQ